MPSLLRKSFDPVRNAGELVIAAKGHRLHAVVEMVDDKGVDKDTRNTQGESMLMAAVAEGSFGIFTFAMEKQPELNFVAADGTTALDRARALARKEAASIAALAALYPPGAKNRLTGAWSCKGEAMYGSLHAAGAMSGDAVRASLETQPENARLFVIPPAKKQAP